MTNYIIGHRGNGRTKDNPFAAGKAPQHTLRSFREAVAHGADGVEFDIFLTRDGIPVIHDDGFFHGRSLSTLFNDEIRASRRSDVDYVPTFQETLEVLAELGEETGKPLILNVELKGPSVVEPTLKVFRDALATTSLSNDQFHFFSGDRDKISLLRELDADAQIQPSIRTNYSFPATAIQMPGYFVDRHVRYNKGMIEELRDYLVTRNCNGIDMPLMDIREEVTDLAGELGIGISTYPSGPRRIESVPVLDKTLALLSDFNRHGGSVIYKSDDIPATRELLDGHKRGSGVCQNRAEKFMGMYFLPTQAFAH